MVGMVEMMRSKSCSDLFSVDNNSKRMSKSLSLGNSISHVNNTKELSNTVKESSLEHIRSIKPKPETKPTKKSGQNYNLLKIKRGKVYSRTCIGRLKNPDRQTNATIYKKPETSTAAKEATPNKSEYKEFKAEFKEIDRILDEIRETLKKMEENLQKTETEEDPVIKKAPPKPPRP